ncbi:MAG: cell division ATP-binding protein FtsE, partial [Polyangiales bacterium]
LPLQALRWEHSQAMDFDGCSGAEGRADASNSGVRAWGALGGAPVLQHVGPLVLFQQVYKYFRRDVPTLRALDLCIERGEFVFVTGASGAGKSTLLQLLYRALVADAGQVRFCGRDLATLTAVEVASLRRNLGVVFQDFRVVPHWSVFDNCAVALEILNLPARVLRVRVAETLERVGLAGRGAELAATLSGGEQQRVAVARAIATQPMLLLADEPTGNLDPQLAIDVLTLFEEINATGTTVIFATHDHSLLQKRQHRIVALEAGRVVHAGAGLGSWPQRRAALAVVSG